MWFPPGHQSKEHPLACETVMGERFAYWGSDKSTFHAYDPIYEVLIPQHRWAHIEFVLEIGVADGGSVLAWRDIFPNAHIVGLDLAPCNHPDAQGDRLELHVGDLRDPEVLKRVVKGRFFDLIVEDASHVLDDNLRALFFLLPWLAEGGMYVIEELDRQAPIRSCAADWEPEMEALGAEMWLTKARGKAPGGEALFVVPV